ncbi:whey acidic protein-like [Sciurus carolinensis]|uniref:whey acidic protein-like n=1 Tax=Sciurus carolinensis TaxID=30640 RepID=UPI001FB28DAE|nr:whey acidic protein-like [Sciurus carolinensis]
MRCLISLALGLLALEVALALDPAFISPAQVMCPESSSSEEMPCTQACLTDEDCLGNTKCCPSACGRSCRTPIIVAAPKTGSCPWVGEQMSQQCQEQDQCSNDSQCEGNKKCCFSQCAMRCLNPVLGMQPQDHPLGPFLPWLSLTQALLRLYFKQSEDLVSVSLLDLGPHSTEEE